MSTVLLGPRVTFLTTPVWIPPPNATALSMSASPANPVNADFANISNDIIFPFSSNIVIGLVSNLLVFSLNVDTSTILPLFLTSVTPSKSLKYVSAAATSVASP